MIKHITWKNEAEMQRFTIGIIDGDSFLFDALKARTNNITIRGKNIVVEEVSDTSSPAPTYAVLFFAKKKLSHLVEFQKHFKQALVITDDEVKQEHQMIRFVYKSNIKNIDVRVNRDNLINRGFKVSNALLLFAGSKFDLSEQLKAKEAYLKNLAATVKTQELKISQSEILLLKGNEKLLRAQQVLSEKMTALKTNENLLAQVNEEKQKAQNELNKNQIDIADQQKVILNKEEERIDQDKKLQQLNTNISQSEERLKQVLSDLGKQSRIIKNNEKTIGGQRLLLYLAIIVTVIFLIIKYFLWKMIRKRKQANKELSALNDKLYQLATIDHMTKLFNRKHFLESAQREIAQQHRTKNTSAILMLDIDHFKKVNDSYGHAKGDEVLIFVATELKDAMREYDLVGRLGGEEFAMYLSDCQLDKAMLIAERIREKVESLTIPHENDLLQITISIGVSVVTTEDNDISIALKRADKALYQSKHSGRNKVSLFNESIIVSD